MTLVVAVPEQRVAQVRLLWSAPGIEVHHDVQTSTVWLRCLVHDEALEQRLRKIAGAVRYTLLDDQQLVPVGRRVPTALIPEGPWKLLTEWLVPRLPAVRFAGRSLESIELHLVRSSVERQATALCGSLEDWTWYATHAAAVRLARWSFAADGTGRVLIRGRPLPAMPGQFLVEDGALFIPSGWTWSVPIDAVSVARRLCLSGDDRALFHPDGTWERLSALDWVQASRSSVRASREAVHGTRGPCDGEDTNT